LPITFTPNLWAKNKKQGNKMAVYPANLSGSDITIAPVPMNLGIKKAVEEIVSRLGTITTGHNGLSDEVQVYLDDLKSKVDALGTAKDTDVVALTQKITAINNVINEAGVVTDIFGGLDRLADELNATREVTIAKDVDFNSATGEMSVDLTALGFANVTDYKVVAGYSGSKPAVVSTEKTSKTSAKIIARDLRHFAEDDVKYKADGEGNNFEATLIVSYTRPVISFTLTNANSTETIGA
jgi:hypothetical protein